MVKTQSIDEKLKHQNMLQLVSFQKGPEVKTGQSSFLIILAHFIQTL
jgi:hypothetical protein